MDAPRMHGMADPFEENDLIADPSRRELLAELRGQFAKLKAAAR